MSYHMILYVMAAPRLRTAGVRRAAGGGGAAGSCRGATDAADESLF